MAGLNPDLYQRRRYELESLIIRLIKLGIARKPGEVHRFIKVRSSSGARKAFKLSVPFFGYKDEDQVDRATLAKIFKFRMSEDLRKILSEDPEGYTRDILSDLLDKGRLVIGKGWTIKIPAPPK